MDCACFVSGDDGGAIHLWRTGWRLGVQWCCFFSGIVWHENVLWLLYLKPRLCAYWMRLLRPGLNIVDCAKYELYVDPQSLLYPLCVAVLV